jgi:hypothetical protein
VNFIKEESIDQNELIRNFMQLSEKKIRNQQMLKQREIDMFVEKNASDMYNSMKEIRESYEREIAEVDEETFGEIVQSLKEEMEGELENIRNLYEMEKNNGIEKINNKYHLY